MPTADSSGLKAAALARWEATFAEVAAELRADLRGAAPFRTGQLENSITVTVNRQSETVFSLVAESPLTQAATTNYGARPHVITPKRVGGVLSFYWPKAGKQVFARQVHHPGNVGTHWWTKIIEAMPSRLAKAFGG